MDFYLLIFLVIYLILVFIMIIVGTINEERKSFVFFSDKNKNNISKFHDSLKNTGWQSIYNENDANIAYGSFLSKYFDICNSSVPLKK